MAQGHLRQIGQAIQPDAPLFGGRKRAERINQRKGEMFQTFELLNAAFDVGAMRVVFLFEIAQLRLQFGAQSAQAASPTVAAADYGGVHQQLFPTDGDIEREAGVIGQVGQGPCTGRLERREHLVVRRNPLRRAG